MASGYLDAVREHLPDAAHVLDRFHVMKLFNEKLSDLRRDLFREATDSQQRRVLKDTRWLLLKRSHRLDEGRGEQERLDEALRLNEPLAIAYYLKEELTRFWEQPSQSAAEGFLEDWTLRAFETDIAPLRQMANNIWTQWNSLLN